MWSRFKYHKLTNESIKRQRTFAKAYLKQLNLSYEEEDIDLLLYDVMCGLAYHVFQSPPVGKAFKNKFNYINEIIAFQRRANEDKNLQKLVRESNVHLAMIKSRKDNNNESNGFLDNLFEE